MSFDPDSFLNTSVEAELDTKYPTFPAGKYQAIVDDLDSKDGTIGKGPNIGKPWLGLVVKFSVQDEGVKELLGRDKVIISKMIFLDIDEQYNMLTGKGKNIELGKLRKALGQNNEGEPWSPNMMVGQMLMIDVIITGEGTDAERNEVRGFASMDE